MRRQVISDELYELLHPADLLDVPVPGFPTHEALVAWAHTKPRDALVAAATALLKTDEWEQQYAAMGLLRELDVPVRGEGHGALFRWIVGSPSGAESVIEPANKPDDLDGGAGPAALAELDRVLAEVAPARPRHHLVDDRWGREIRNLLAHSINTLADRTKIILTLYYFEGLSLSEIAEVLGVDEAVIDEGLRDALLRLRRALRSSDRQDLRQYLKAVLGEVPLDSRPLSLAALLAA